MYEHNEVLAVNSHDLVLELFSRKSSLSASLQELQNILVSNEIPNPQLLGSTVQDGFRILITGPAENLLAIQNAIKKSAASSQISLSSSSLCSVSVTCKGSYSADLTQKITTALEGKSIPVHQLFLGSMTITVVIPRESKSTAISALHALIEK